MKSTPCGHRLFHRIPLGNATDGFDGIAAGAVPAQVVFDHEIGLGEGLIHFAEGKNALVDDIGPVLFPNQRTGRFQGLRRVHHWREHFILHLNQVQRVFGYIATGGGHGRNRLAHEPHLVFGQTVAGPTNGKARHRSRPLFCVLTCNNGNDAFELFCLGGVDTLDAGVCVGTLEDGGMQHVG